MEVSLGERERKREREISAHERTLELSKKREEEEIGTWHVR